jgi:hypothetical protein
MIHSIKGTGKILYGCLTDIQDFQTLMDKGYPEKAIALLQRGQFMLGVQTK